LDKLNRLIEIITDIAEDRDAGDIRELTGQETEEPVRTIAEAVGGMIAKVEAREHHLETLSRQVEESNRRTRHGNPQRP